MISVANLILPVIDYSRDEIALISRSRTLRSASLQPPDTGSEAKLVLVYTLVQLYHTRRCALDRPIPPPPTDSLYVSSPFGVCRRRLAERPFYRMPGDPAQPSGTAALLHRGVVAGRTAPALCADVDPVGARCPDRTDAYRVTTQQYQSNRLVRLRAAS